MISTEFQIDRAELNRRVADYMCTQDFQAEVAALASAYRAEGLPVPPYEVLQGIKANEMRKCLENLMICEAKGHLWKETADPENGTSTLSCRRCGTEDHLRW